ncbi:MAG: hypothetical protein WD749_01740 [Phycisphaerales bacterium]
MRLPPAIAAPLLAPLLLAALVALPGCTRYQQDSPEAVIASAKEMVKNGHAERLPDLIYADSREMRELLDKLGEVLGTLQDLAKEVQAAFPDEIEAYKQEAEEAAKRGEASSFVQRLAGQTAGAARRPRPPSRSDMTPEQAEQARSAVDTLMKDLFADPYGWLERSEGPPPRLTVSREGCPDDMAKVLWDDKPFLGVGLALKSEGGTWYIALPLDNRAAARILPKSPESWEIMASALEVVDSMLGDLRDDVRTRRVKRLEDLAQSAGEKAFLPAALVMLAYGKVKEAERKPTAPPAPPATRAAPQPATASPGEPKP